MVLDRSGKPTALVVCWLAEVRVIQRDDELTGVVAQVSSEVPRLHLGQMASEDLLSRSPVHMSMEAVGYNSISKLLGAAIDGKWWLIQGNRRGLW